MGPPPADDVALWFLTAAERGNPDTRIDADPGRTGATVTAWRGPRATRCGRWCTAPSTSGACWTRGGPGRGDLLLLTDWRGDGDERLDGSPGSELATVLVGLVERGVDVRGLVWRSHPHQAHLSEQEAIHLAEAVNEAGGEILLDERVRRAGSHHQKMVLVRHPGHEADDVAFVGGIDLCHGRRRRATPRRPAGHRHRAEVRRPPALARRPVRDPGPGDRRPGPHVPRAVGRSHAARPPQPVAGPHRPGGA